MVFSALQHLKREVSRTFLLFFLFSLGEKGTGVGLLLIVARPQPNSPSPTPPRAPFSNTLHHLDLSFKIERECLQFLGQGQQMAVGILGYLLLRFCSW